MKYLLDTNAVIAILNRNTDFIQRLKQHTPADFALSAITWFELHYGAHKSQKAAENLAKLEKLAEQILRKTGLAVRVTANTKSALKAADIIIAVTSAVDSIIEPEDLKSGAIVCDVARPRNVSRRVAEMRDDILVIEGGVVEVPGDVNFGLHFGFPEKTAYACMAETMILALEQRYENFTLGRDLTVKQVETIDQLAKKHGFKLAGFRSFERALSPQEIQTIKNNSKTKGELDYKRKVIS